MKAFKLLTIVAFVLMLMFAIGCGQKEEAQPEPAQTETMMEEAADSLQGEMEEVADSLQQEGEEMMEEATGH
ncbi:MAG: hypothetical protein R3F48_02035 [Candidatus Zixiibacteriota bacterium]